MQNPPFEKFLKLEAEKNRGRFAVQTKSMLLTLRKWKQDRKKLLNLFGPALNVDYRDCARNSKSCLLRVMDFLGDNVSGLQLVGLHDVPLAAKPTDVMHRVTNTVELFKAMRANGMET